MKKLLLTLILVMSVCFGLFAQQLTYQAVIRDANQQLVMNTGTTTYITIQFNNGDLFRDTVSATTNAHGLLTFAFGDNTLLGRDWAEATMTVTVRNNATPSIVYLNNESRSVNAVPYALSVNGQSVQNYLDANHYLDADSIRRTIGDTADVLRGLMDGNASEIATLAGRVTTAESHITTARDSIHTLQTEITGLQAESHTHANKAVLDRTQQAYRTADSTKLAGIETLAQVNVNADWNATSGDAQIMNKPSLDTMASVSNLNTLAGRVTTAESHITTARDSISTLQTEITGLQAASHTHANKAVLDRTQQAYRTADSTKLAGIEALAEVNVNADWNETDNTKDAYIRNKPTIPAAANNATLTIQKNNTSIGTFSANASTDTTINVGVPTTVAELTDASDYAKVAGNTYTGSHDFTGATTTVASGFTFGTTTTSNCGNVAVNACDLLAVFDSLRREIASLRARIDTLQSTPTPTPTLTITSNPAASSVKLCGGTSITYTATVANGTATSYTWSTSGGDTTTTSNSYMVTYNSAGTYTVICTAAGVSAIKSVTITSDGTPATLGLCEDCNAGSITLKSGNCTSLTWVNNADASKTGTVSSIPADSIVLRVNTDSPAGVYTITGTNSDGCTVTRTATLGNYVAHPCSVTTKNSNEMGSTTAIDSVSDHEGNWYKVVQIGNQCWLAENMRCKTSPKGNLTAGDNTKSHYLAYYYNNTSATQFSLRERGYLYNWAGAIDTNATSNINASFTNRRGICPQGWHIPTDAEWSTLATNAGCTAQYNSGTGLGKLTGGCDWNSSSNATAPGNYSYADRNSSGFSALPAGYCRGSSFNQVGSFAYFWSTTSYPSDSTYAYTRGFGYSAECVYRYRNYKYDGFSVRCVRDESGVTMSAVTKTDSTGSTLSISAEYTATQAVTSATICAYTDESCTTVAGTCAADVAYSTSPITGTVTGLNANAQYYVKVTATTAGGTESTVAGPFGTENVVITDTITFVANGGTGTMTEQVVNRGTAVAIRTNTFTHTGNWEFTGWNDACDGNGTTYADAANITTSGNVTLYAQWHTFCTVSARNTTYENGTSNTRIDSVKDHQSNWYKVVQIGNQCWLKENMRATTEPVNSTSILQNPAQSNSSYTARYAYYPGDLESNYQKYGCLYTFPAAMNITTQETSFTYPHRGICPAGWHIPTDAEWTTMATNAGVSEATTGIGLGKLTGGCDWPSKASGTTYPGTYSYSERNSSGFSALPAGYRPGTKFSHVGDYAYFWSASSNNADYASDRRFYNYCQYLSPGLDDRYVGCSVRCVRDENVTLSITSDKSSATVQMCGASSVTVTYTATVEGGTASSYAWSTSDGTATASTSNTYTVTYTTAGNYTVSCTAAGVSATASITIASDGAPATMTACEDYATPKVTVTTNCTTSSLVWINSSGETKLTGSAQLTGNSTITNGYYTVTGVNSSGCSITKKVQLGAMTNGCPVTSKRDNETWSTYSNGKIASVKDHQNNSYAVVSIGGICIMAQNLRVTTSPAGHSLSEWGSSNSTSASYYKKNTTYSNNGYVYNWRAALDTTIDVRTIGSNVDIPNRRGLCPAGWHLPTRSEWASIVNCHTAIQFASESNWTTDATPNAPGYTDDDNKNITGFSGVPVGYYNDSFISDSTFANFWSATSASEYYAYTRYLTNNSDSFGQNDYSKSYGYSIRCVRDE